MKINKIILLITLTLILLGITYATENNTDTTIQDNPIQETIKHTQEQNTIKNLPTQEKPDNKEIKKQNTQNKSIKTVAKTININNFQTLHNTLTSNKYNILTLNIKSNIKLTSNTKLNKAITKVTINGNGKTINGQNKYQFLNITPKNNVIINNMKIINCKSSELGGALYNKGTLTIKKSQLKNNTVLCNKKLKYKDTFNYGGGAIYNSKKLTIIQSTVENNKGSSLGGAIYNNGTLTITKSKFNNNKATVVPILDDYLYYDSHGGAIYNNGTITITQSTINNNRAESNGGAILNNGILTIIQSKLNNNKINNCGYMSSGGAIMNHHNLKLIKCTLNNNKAYFTGGATENMGNMVITNSTLNNNIAEDETGGAINSGGNLIITNSTLKNNKASTGGAISNDYGNLTITHSILNNNTAKWNGGAIYIRANSKNIKINSNFTKNHAKQLGGAIYNEAPKAIIIGTFNYNHANNKYNLIYNKGKNCKIKATPSKYKNSNYGGAIYNEGNKVTINIKTTQKTKIEQFKTNITINNIATVYKGNTITISGKFTDETGNTLKNTLLTLNINGKQYKTKTNQQGKYVYKYKTNTTGTNKITVTYKGNTKYTKTSTHKTFTVKNKINTKITLKNIPTVNIGEDIPIKGKFTDTAGNPLKNTVLNVKINNEKYTMNIDKTGSYNYVYTTQKTGKNTITISYPGNNTHAKTSVQKTFTVTNYKKITMYMKSPTSIWPTKNINGDIFAVHYNKQGGQYDAGAYAEIHIPRREGAAANKIVKTIFYHKNSNGQIITNTGSRWYYITCFRAPIISGYTPYKVDIYYIKNT